MDKQFRKKRTIVSLISYGQTVYYLSTKEKKVVATKNWPIKKVSLNNGLSLICDDTPSRDKQPIRDE